MAKTQKIAKFLKNGPSFQEKSLKMGTLLGRGLRLEQHTPVQLKSEYPPSFQVGSVGQDIYFLFLIFFSHSVGKNDSPKISQKIWGCSEKKKKKLEKCFQLFSKIFSQFSLTLAKNNWFYSFSKLKKKEKLPKWKIWIGRAHKTGFFFHGLSNLCPVFEYL